LIPSDVTFVQLSDTHVVGEGHAYPGLPDTARHLRDAIAAVNALRPAPAFAVVTGDLCHHGSRDEYAHFARLFAGLHVPYFVVPGNHDNVERLREVLPPASFGGAGRDAFAYARDADGVRLLALDSTVPHAVSGVFDSSRLAWLAATLAAEPDRPTVIALHQPPFRTRLHYLDFLPYPGVVRFRAIVDENPQVKLVIGGHIHCVRAARWKAALALTAPSTAPQIVPELFERRMFALRREAPGFILYRGDPRGSFEAIVYRRERDSGRYAPTEHAFAAPRATRSGRAAPDITSR
jgi:3',5'-cyclic AMP phosphodiesterase CpdA